MTVPLQPPESIQSLIDELQARGFAIDDEQFSAEAFGDGIIALRRGAVRVRAVRDRGQCCLEVANAAGNAWFSPMVWRDVVEGRLGALETSSLEQQAEFVLRNLGGIDAFVQAGERTDSQLLQARTNRASARRDAGT